MRDEAEPAGDAEEDEAQVTWLLAALSLVGVVLNILHSRWSFGLWFITNLSWAWVDFSRGISAQGCLFVIYAVLSVVGWLKWSEDKSY